jgi:phospholipid/cholesterol/gamma-HCH transport system substrate-binding protein
MGAFILKLIFNQMETSAKSKIRLGLFISIAALLFVGAVFYLGKKRNLFTDTFNIHGIFGNVSGLQVGNNVRFAGITVGSISNILILNDTSVKVDMVIENSTKKFIKKDSYASIGTEGLMGDRVVNITQGTFASSSIEENEEIKTMEPVETDAILTSLQATGENAEFITSQLAEIFFKINSGEGVLGRLIQDSAFAGNLTKTIDNLKSGTEGFSQNMEAAKHSFFLRGYYKKKNKEKEEQKKEVEETKEQNDKEKK